MCNLYTEKENLIVFYKISYNFNLIYTETQTKTARFIASTYIEILSKYMPHPSTRLYKYWIPLLPALLLNFTITYWFPLPIQILVNQSYGIARHALPWSTRAPVTDTTSVVATGTGSLSAPVPQGPLMTMRQKHVRIEHRWCRHNASLPGPGNGVILMVYKFFMLDVSFFKGKNCFKILNAFCMKMIKKYFAFKIEFVLNNCIKPSTNFKVDTLFVFSTICTDFFFFKIILLSL